MLQLQALRKKIVGVGVTESEFMEVCKRVCERLALRGLVRLASTPVRREGLCGLRRWRAELPTVCITITGLIVLLLRKCNMLRKCNKSRVLDEVSESSGIAGAEEN